ncbi:MAG: prephenate dehydratase [Cytophagales bacterium]|nr:prephenate dehydratase [Cytophagales bacterium]
MPEPTLDQLRREIDQIDNQIMDLLNARMEVVRQVGELKKASQTVIYRPEREKAIIDRLAQRSAGLLGRPAIEAIFLEIFAISRNLELPEQVAYLGPDGSFTHQAAESRFGALSKYVALSSIETVFEFVDTGKVRFGVVPIENNQEGVVTETIALLGSYELKIVAEIPMAIHFAFASVEDSVERITKIYSRDIGLRQCRHFLNEMFPQGQAELVPVNSTSKAAELAALEPGSAALCSHIAAKQNGLPILFDNVEDSDTNQTRFIILGKNINNQKGERDKTSILAKLGDEPGALFYFLKDFHEAGINLTKIESQPAKKGKSFKYWFFIDFDGHYQEPKVAAVLAKREKEIKLLGSYVKLC